MSELRLDLATGEWVIIATERARRPHDFRRADAAAETPRETCPFCPGREAPQLVATPVVPLWIQTKHAVARRYWDVNRRCLYYDLLDAELGQKERVLLETERFGVFQPFASRLPFETWIMPKRHTPSFGDIRDDELQELAGVLRATFRLLGGGLGPFPYNYVIHSALAGEEDRRSYLWHLEILPRLTMIAGFEMGSRIFINTAAPEATAGFLRSLAPEAALE